jgi:glycosyltransferase involved in cell wall biosynthesis
MIDVIPNGVDLDHYSYGQATPAPDSLVFSGALTYEANYDAMRYFLAEIYPLVRSMVPGVRLQITGRSSGIDLRALALDSSVVITGYLPDVRPVVAGSWVCVVPLRLGGGTRLKILEAMALGTPVVTTTKGAEGLEVVPGEDIIIADHPATFAAATADLLRDERLREKLARNARRLVKEKYGWEAIGQKLNDLATEVVASHRGF